MASGQTQREMTAANERFTCSANLRQAAGENRSTGPSWSWLVSRTAIRSRAWPTSTHSPPFPL
jgi:hypothetical protein